MGNGSDAGPADPGQNRPVETYIDSVSRLDYRPVSAAVWRTIRSEGLDEERELPAPSDWSVARLPVSGADSSGLRDMTDDALEKFNGFDIALKDRYGGAVVDLIDYEQGVIRIVCPAGFDFGLTPSVPSGFRR